MAFRSILSKLRSLSTPLFSPKPPTVENYTSQNLPQKTIICYRTKPPGTSTRKDHRLEKIKFQEDTLFTQCVAIDISHTRALPSSPKIGVFSAFAINYDIKLLGTVYGTRKYGKIENLEYFAILKGLHLDEELRKRGLHDSLGFVKSCFAHPLNYLKEVEKGYHFGDLCFREDDETNTCEMVIGGVEEICEKLPQVLLDELEKIKAAFEEEKKKDRNKSSD